MLIGWFCFCLEVDLFVVFILVLLFVNLSYLRAYCWCLVYLCFCLLLDVVAFVGFYNA